MKSYLSIETVSKDVIYHRFLENGERKEEFINFKPFCGVESSGTDSKITSLYGKALELKTFESMSEYRTWKKENESMIPIHGDIRVEYMFCASKYQKEIPIQWEHMRIDNFDIEVYVNDGGGFPEAAEAKYEVSAITVQDIIKKTYTVFGWKNYLNHREDVTYIHCDDEKDLLKQYVTFMAERKPDIITGWNIIAFDIPYMVHRIEKVLGKGWSKKLSQINKLKKRTYTDNFDNEVTTYNIGGTNIFDYMELYAKFNFEPRDGKSLEIIAQAELGKGKLDYKDGEERTLIELFEEDFQTYIDYNIQDTTLVGELDDKLQFIQLAVNMTYMAKCQFSDVFGTVGIWDAYLYNKLIEQKILCPPRKTNIKSSFPGGWVKVPKTGLHGWTMVFDIASSYPNSIISYNISPECIIEFDSLPTELQVLADLIRPTYDQTEGIWIISDYVYDIQWVEENIKPLLKKYDVCLTAWGEYFRRDKIGFIPTVVDDIFKSRKAVKAGMKKIDFSSMEYQAMDAKQMAFKILMNSLYGAMSNVWFRYFDIRMAGAVTSSGQTSVKGAEKFIEDTLGIKNHYIDTDSIFLDFQPLLDQRFKDKPQDFIRDHDFCMKLGDQVIQPKLTEFFDRLVDGMNCVQNTLVMESEALADTWLIVGKKHYSMRIVNDEGTELFNRETGKLGKWNFDHTEFKEQVKLKTRGLSLIQSTTPHFAREKLKRAVEVIFETKNEQTVKALFAAWKKEFQTLPFEQIAKPIGVTTFNKYIENQFGAQAHVRAALTFNKYLKVDNLDKKYEIIRQGDKIKFAYLKMPNSFESDVIACLTKFPKEWSTKLLIDWETQWQKCFTAQLEHIFDHIGWNISEDEVSMEDFFS